MKKYFVSLLMVSIAVLHGCGGGSSTPVVNNPVIPPAAKTVTGVAATGSPISGTVYLKDSSSPAIEISTPIGADGSYSFDVSSLTAPYILKAVGTANGQNYTLYSLAGAPGIANINPLSHLAVVQANSGADPASLYANLTPVQTQAIKDALVTIIPQIQALLQQVLSQYGATTTNFISDAYTVNHTGLDLLFDLIAIVVNNGNVTMTNKGTGAAILTTNISGNTLSGQVAAANIPTITSQAMGMVYAYSTNTGIVTGGTATYRAIVIGVVNQAVTWSVVETGGGSITSLGVYTAPATVGTYHVKATSGADGSKSATTPVTVSAIGGGISGAVVTTGGVALPGATVTLTGTSSGTATTNSSGSFAFTGLANGNYTLSTSLSGYTFTPSSISVAITNGSATGKNFVGSNALNTATIASNWSISGTRGTATAAGTIHLLQGGIMTYSFTNDGSGSASSGTGTWTLPGTALTIIYDRGAVYTGPATGTSINFTLVADNGWTMDFVRLP